MNAFSCWHHTYYRMTLFAGDCKATVKRRYFVKDLGLWTSIKLALFRSWYAVWRADVLNPFLAFSEHIQQCIHVKKKDMG